MKKENKNFLYNLIYQVFTFLIPLITTPYISRVLGVDNVGIYSYTYSIVYYFMMGSMIGINNYGARTIAKNEKNKEIMSKKFISIYLLQLSLSIIMIISYILFLTITSYQYKNIMMIQLIFLLSAALDINWFFFGLEKFKITISRNIIIKLFSLILIFVFVKSSNDLWIYTLIMSMGTLISQLYLWIFVKKEIKFVKVNLKNILEHLKPCLILFIPVIAYSIYRVMDKTMIGYIACTTELGYYESAEKIINIPISLITALGTVMLPHMSKLEMSKIKEKINESFELCFCFVVPMIIGLIIISKDFTLIYFGKEFMKTSQILSCLIITILFSGVANVIRTNYLIPSGNDRIYVTSTILGAVINLILNLIFIPKYASMGACIGTIIAEFVVMIYQIIMTRKNINYRRTYNILLKYLFKGIIMGVIIFVIGKFINNIYIKLIIQIIVAVLLYFIMVKNYIINDFLCLKKKEKAE